MFADWEGRGCSSLELFFFFFVRSQLEAGYGVPNAIYCYTLYPLIHISLGWGVRNSPSEKMDVRSWYVHLDDISFGIRISLFTTALLSPSTKFVGEI